MNQLEKAEMVARWAHRNQTDLEGMPYWTHCARVAHNLKAAGYDETIQAIGWLHDVIEDTDVTANDMLELFPTYNGVWNSRLYQGVVAMTQHANEPLDQYWSRVKTCEDARVCKLFGDIPDNDDPRRGERLTAVLGDGGVKRARQHNKYLRARQFLMTPEEYKKWSNVL